MIGIILVALLVIGIILLVIDDHCGITGFLCGFGVFCLVVGGAGTFLVGLATGIEYATVEAHKTAYVAEAQMLQDQIDKGKPDGEVLVKAIAFNTDVIKHREYTHNFWTGIMEPDFYDEVPLVNID